MLYRVLLKMAILIFVINYFALPTFFNIEPDSSGTFIGLILMCIVIMNLLDRKQQ